MAVHPSDPQTAWFVPAVKDEIRIPRDGALSVTLRVPRGSVRGVTRLEGFDMFEDMKRRIQEDVVQKLFTVELAREAAPEVELQALDRLFARGLTGQAVAMVAAARWITGTTMPTSHRSVRP